MWTVGGGHMIQEVDDKVEANYRGKGRWYPGKISRVRLNGSYDVSYDDGETEVNVRADFIRVVGNTKKSSNPARGGRIEEGSKVEVKYGDYFNPGRVKRDRGNGTYDIDYNDGKQESRVPTEMIQCLEIGHADVVQLLLSAGANIEATDKVILMIHNARLYDYFLWSEY